MAEGGYTVQPSVLRTGSGLVSDLQSEWVKLAGSVTEAFSALAAAAGDAGVESAATSVGVAAFKQFLNANAVYQHTEQSLLTSATAYANAESNATSAVTSIRLTGER
jgi:hypothetical protein